MRVQAEIADDFSPYLNESPIYDGIEEYRAPTATALALLIHSGLFLTFSMTFLLPIQPDEPEIIPVKIYTEIVEVKDDIPTQVSSPIITPAAPTPKPRPRPTSKPLPALPPPLPTVEPLTQIVESPDPEPIPAPAPPILVDEAPLELEDLAVADPSRVSDAERLAAVEKLMAQDLERQAREQERLPEPIIEIPPIEPERPAEPLVEIVPDIIVDPILEPILEPIIEPVLEPEPIEEPIIEPELIFEPVEEPLPQLPVFEDTPEPLTEEPKIIVEAPEPEFIIPDAAPGAIVDTPPLDPLQDEPLVLPEPEPVLPEVVIAEPEPQLLEPAQPDVTPEETPAITPDKPIDPISEIETPKVLADSAAPTNQQEQDRAVDKSQASTGSPSSTPQGGGRYQTPNVGGNSGGGGAINRRPNGPVPSGVAARPKPGTRGWSLAPSGSYIGDRPKGGLGGISIDMRCRDVHRNHDDCPEYVGKPRGRAADGTEGFGAHSVAGSARGRPNATSNIGASASPFGSGKDFTAHTNGGPSTNVLDDAGFAREFRNQPLILSTPSSDLNQFRNAPIGTQPSQDFDLSRKPEDKLPEEKDPWSLR